MKNHKDLDAWKESIQLAVAIFKILESFPSSEMYGLTSQIKRSVVSISSNIAEGAARGSKKEFSRFLNIALGSLSELETQMIISKELKFYNDDKVFNDIARLQRLIGGLIRYTRKNQNSE